MSTTTTAGLSLDQAEALRFLELLGKDPAQTRFRFFAPKGHPQAAAIGARKGVGFRPAEIERHQAAGCGAYAVIGDGGDTDATITSIPALFVEWDNRPVEWQVGAWSELGLPEPSLQVETGGKSVHSYWVLREPLPPDQWREVTARLIRHCDSDRTIGNPSRVMRLPGAHYIGADGRPIAQSRIITAAGHRYRPEQILAGVAELPAQPAGKPTSTLQAPPCGPRPPRRTDHPARPLSAIKEALAAIPPILPDTGQRETYRALAWGLLQAVRDAGEADAVALDLLGSHSPAVKDAGEYLRTDPRSITAGTFWHLAKEAGWRPCGEHRPTPEPVVPVLPAPDLIASAGQHLAAAVNLKELAEVPLLLVDAPMGCGKTRLAAELMAPYLQEGVPVIAPTHRTALGESQAEAVGLAWAPAPDTDERLQGLGLCWDSLRPSSGLAIHPDEWDGADGGGPVLLLDEVSQGLEHLLFTAGTAVAQHRPETMATAAALLRSARSVVAMDAQLNGPVLRLLEALTGNRATLLRSEAQPMAGRSVLVPQGLTARTAAEQGRARVLELAKDRRRVFVFTTAKQTHAKGAAANLAALVRKHWPEAKVLVIDSENPEAAEQLGRNPNGTAAAHDWIICSPSITSGLSIDGAGLFDEVLVIGAGGRLPAEHLVQAAARVRDRACPVRIYAPGAAPQLRIGSGDTDPAALLRHLASSESHLLAALVDAGGWEASATNESPWLRCYLELAALKNRQAAAYAATVAALLRREGWQVDGPVGLASSPLAQEAGVDLEEIAAAATAAADAAVVAAEPLTDAEASELSQRRRLSDEERIQLKRHRIAERWALGAAPPTPEVMEADRQAMAHRHRFRWLLQQSDRRELATTHDRRRSAQLTHKGRAWAPDMVRELLLHKLEAAEAIGLTGWLEGAGEWIAGTDARLTKLQTTAIAHASSLKAQLGVSPGKRASGTLRTLAGLIGCRLEARRHRCAGARGWSYRLVPEVLPVGVDSARLEVAWRDQLQHPS